MFIKTPEELIERLNIITDPLEYFEALQSKDISFESIEKYLVWSDDHPTKNCIALNDNFALVLMCLEKDQATNIEDFDDSQAWIHPILGTIKEDRYLISKRGNGLLKISSVTLNQDDFSYTKHTGIHQYTNIHGARSVVLILYNKPILEKTIYTCNDTVCSTSKTKQTYDNICLI